MTSSSPGGRPAGIPLRQFDKRRRLLAMSIAASAILAACSSTGEVTTEASTPASPSTAPSDAAPSSEPVETTAAPTTPVPDTTQAAVQAQAVGFAKDVMPVLENNCASCHGAGGPGSAHFPMTVAKDIQDNAEFLSILVETQTMPPWPAGDGDVTFHDDRRLTAEEIESVVEWVADGATLDVDPTTPIVAAAQTVTPIDRDIVIKGLPFKGDRQENDDNYRCQIYDPKLTETSFVTGMALEPDRVEVVHHALLFTAKAASREASERLDASQEGAGWTCPGLASSGDENPAEQVMSWAPGQAPTLLPEGTAVKMEPGDFFITQIHYHYAPEWDALAPDESAMVFQLADADDIAAAGGQLDPIKLTLYLAPAEIPCSKDEAGPLCDRATAASQLGESGGVLGGLLADALMAQCGYTVDDFASMTDGIASASCDLPATPGQIINIWGHEHEIGSTFKMTLNPGTPEEKVLLDIPRWAFEWQLNYFPIEDIVLDADDVIRVECSWDRDKLPDDAEPRYILWAEGTTDEMCFSQIVTRPVKAA